MNTSTVVLRRQIKEMKNQNNVTNNCMDGKVNIETKGK